MKKGITSWLTIFLSVAIGLILLVVMWNSVGESRVLSEGAGTTGSAVDLGNAIRSVYQCAEESDDPEEDCKEFVNISMPQHLSTYWKFAGKPIKWMSVENDPKWIIYYGDDHKKGNIDVIDKEIDKSTDIVHILDDKCPDGICYGMVEMSNNDKIPLEKEILDKLEPFWLLSPCGAEVKVYYDNGKIKICKIKDVKGKLEDDKYNFCWNRNADESIIPGSTLFDTTWPEKSGNWDCSSDNHLSW